jgi:diguanylate cyclase (GGDEF)-like protein
MEVLPTIDARAGLTGSRPPPDHRLAAVLDSRPFKLVGGGLLVVNLVVLVWLGLRPSSGQAQWGFWLMNGLMVLPILSCLARAVVGGKRRAGVVWLGAAMVAYAVGNVIYVGWTQYQAHPPVPSPADVAYLVFYPCVAAAVICFLRREDTQSAKGLWLDGALGAAGAATVLAAVLSPTLTSTGDLGPVVVSGAFTVGDLLLIAMVFGILAIRGLRGASLWLWLGVGLATFCAADVGYALHVASGTFVVGTLWGSLWVVGLTIAAFAIWRPEQSGVVRSGRSTAMLAIPLLATVAAVVVLVVSSFEQLATVVVALATLTLVLAGVRTVVAFGQVRRLSDAHRQAVTDELTGLGNRRALFERGDERLSQANPSDRIALMLIDLNDFKEVNDSLGHHAGDELLRETARRLAARAHESDLLVRLGGDEFAILFRLRADEDRDQSALRILDRVSQPVVIEGARRKVAATAGMAESLGSECSMSELLRRADVAMYAAKAEGAHMRFHDPKLDEDNRSRLETIQDLDAAIVHGQFLLHYQPVMNVASGKIVSAEALVRWQHPTRGLLYPDTFLPHVEQSGLMGAITRIVVRAAIEQIAAWRAEGMPIAVAVNLSASDLLDEHLADRIMALLAEHDVPVDELELEITESVLMTEPERARDVIDRLRRLGLRVAVDDYGTGYSALAYLRDLAIDELKIDRSFIDGMADDGRSAAIVRSTIELAHALDLEVVAEGVEHEEVLTMLADFGCDFAQGYHFSRPLPAADFAAFVADGELEIYPESKSDEVVVRA